MLTDFLTSLLAAQRLRTEPQTSAIAERQGVRRGKLRTVPALGTALCDFFSQHVHRSDGTTAQFRSRRGAGPRARRVLAKRIPGHIARPPPRPPRPFQTPPSVPPRARKLRFPAWSASALPTPCLRRRGG